MSEPRLVMNPFADVHLHPPPRALPIDPDAVEMIEVKCPVRGHGLRAVDLTRAGQPELFRFFLAVAEGGGELELDSDAPILPALVELGFLVDEDAIPDWPRFSVPLDLPAAAPADWVVADGIRVQAEFALHRDARWPADYDRQEGWLRCFAPGPALWVGDPADLLTPFWIDPAQAAAMAELVPGAPPPRALAGVLAAAGALAPPAQEPRLARFARARPAFESEQRAVVEAVLHPAELRALRRYYAALLAGRLVRLGDLQSSLRFSSYNDPIGRFVHYRLAGPMAAVAGVAVDPTFSYFFSYVGGAELPAHRDRPEAELSISLQLDYAPESGGLTGWPLCFTGDDGAVAAVDLAIGDAVFYRGSELTHHRGRLPAGHQSSHLVLEYIPADRAGLRI
jgi:hypothetical protein